MKLLTSLALATAGVSATTVEDKCLICSHVGFASSEDNAIAALNTDSGEYCAVINMADLTAQHNGVTAKPLFTSTEDAYCVAQFFIYHAEDLGKWVYGINRYGSSSSVAAGLVDVANYDGVKAFQYSIQRTVGDAVHGRKYEFGATTYGANPMFKQRGKFYGLCSKATKPADATNCGADATKAGVSLAALSTTDADCPAGAIVICDLEQKVDCILTGAATDLCDGVSDRTSTVAEQFFMGDGREDDSATALSTVSVQTQKYTRCLVCHGSQEFTIPQAQSSGITDACWNPSGSSSFRTDDDALMDPRHYCQPPADAPYCTTSTWQYSTEDSAGARTSHWVGIKRSCATSTTTHGTEIDATGNNRAASNLKENVRFYAPANTAAKAKDNARYPTSDSANNIAYTVENSDTVFPLDPQFMTSDGTGAPDLPTTLVTPELECISCVTPIGNTDSTNTCVTAKSTGRVKCKTLSCNSVTSAYKLSADASDIFYYSKRGCTVDPDDGKTMGEQDPADSAVVPSGFTAIRQYNQRSTSALGNTGRSSSVNTAAIFDCYSCESSFSSTVMGSNTIEPLYDDIKELDKTLCWETYEPQADTSVTYTGSSGSCEGKCYASAYKYKEVGKTETKYNWYVKRGCDKDVSVASGTTPVDNLFGVQQTNYACTFQNGTLCNGQIAAYDTSLEIKTQSVRLLQCYTCTTADASTDPNDPCFTVPSTAKAVECPDLTYTSCYAAEATVEIEGEVYYFMDRGCSKDPVGVENGIDTFGETADGQIVGIDGTYTVCGSASCNKNNGQLTPVAQAQYLPPAEDDEDEDDGDDAEEDNETEEDAVEEVVEEAEESSALTVAVAATLFSFNLL